MSEQRSSADQEMVFLEKLSIEELEALLKTSGSPNDVEAFFDAVIKEVVKREKKEPTGRLPDVDTAWEELQICCNTSEKLAQGYPEKDQDLDFILTKLDATRSGLGAPVKPHKKAVYRVLRSAAAIAISIALTLSVMIGAQATGINVFEALAAWTDEAFHFVPKKTDTNSQLIDALRSQNMPVELAPTKMPAGMELVETATHSNYAGKSVLAAYEGFDLFLGIEIQECYDFVEEGAPWHEKDTGEVEKFISHGREFYIFSNVDEVMATWTDHKSLVVTVWGNVPIDEIREIISSIGGKL